MGLFSSDRYSRPGPGVNPDTPRKKGMSRLLEILGRDLWSFFRAGLLAFAGMLPFVLGMVLAVTSHAVLLVVLAGVVGGMIAMPELVAMADTVLRSLRDEPGYWWQTYRRVWKRNLKESLLPGAIAGVVFGIQIFTLFHLPDLNATVVTWVMLLVSLILTLGLFSYLLPQIALLDLPFFGILKNSALLFLGYLPRSAGAVLIQLVYWALILLFFPLTLYILPLTSVWVPLVPSLLCIYPALNKSFDIEKTITKMREDHLQQALARDAASESAPEPWPPAPPAAEPQDAEPQDSPDTTADR